MIFPIQSPFFMFHLHFFRFNMVQPPVVPVVSPPGHRPTPLRHGLNRGRGGARAARAARAAAADAAAAAVPLSPGRGGHRDTMVL